MRLVSYSATILHKDLSSALYIAVTYVEGVVELESTCVCAYFKASCVVEYRGVLFDTRMVCGKFYTQYIHG